MMDIVVDIVTKNLAKDVVLSCNIMSGDNWIYFKFFGQIPCTILLSARAAHCR